MKPNTYPSSDFFKSIFSYENGSLYYLESYKNGRYSGKIAGRVQKSGYKKYRQLKIGGTFYYEHRVIWIMENGEIPNDMFIDHVNGDGTDNRLDNLRLVDAQTNNRNKKRSERGSASGLTGVTFDKSCGKWKAHIQIGNRHINLGLFAEKQDAYNARLSANEKHGFHSSHGSMLIGCR